MINSKTSYEVGASKRVFFHTVESEGHWVSRELLPVDRNIDLAKESLKAIKLYLWRIARDDSVLIAARHADPTRVIDLGLLFHDMLRHHRTPRDIRVLVLLLFIDGFCVFVVVLAEADDDVIDVVLDLLIKQHSQPDRDLPRDTRALRRNRSALKLGIYQQ